MIRASILRSTILLLGAIFDPKGRDRAGLGQVVELLGDSKAVEFLLEKRGGGDKASTMRARFEELGSSYARIVESDAYKRMRQLRDDAIAHLLIRDEVAASSGYEEIFELADEAQRLVIVLWEGLGMPGQPHFLAMKDPTRPGSGLFWGTYLAGIGHDV